MGIVYFILYKAIKLKDIIFIFLALKGVDGVFRMVVMGDAFHLLSAKVILTLLVFFVYILLSYAFNKQKIL
ncbi:hypothetical protein A4G18_07975 [Pasteurellaceae bacterium Pebbles2]|nr:hypothetical protein [Pasteurellaceae bacterium Pebbles2]